MNTLTDLVLVVIPAVIMWNIRKHLELRVKLGIMAILCLGVFAAVASIIKTVQMATIQERYFNTFVTMNVYIWST